MNSGTVSENQVTQDPDSLSESYLLFAEPLLELKDISKAYQEGQKTRVVLDEVKISIMPGEIIGFLGKSGTGKSTLLNVISGIDIPNSGTVWFRGRNLIRAQ